ncbi:hypothetical protein BH10BAC5_BH10BAC5_27700 [soil metagenome]
MRCPKAECRSLSSEVVRNVQIDEESERLRNCLDCGHIWMTREVPLPCPRCNKRDSEVTRTVHFNEEVGRWRRCLNCFNVWMTKEFNIGVKVSDEALDALRARNKTYIDKNQQELFKKTEIDKTNFKKKK